ncbi:MAG: ATP-binding protein [Actinomycetota bacterium]|nr:ATP-binding protein [Actinomycetota bacterium]
MRLRMWMPLAAVLVVLLSVASIFVYAIPATRARVADYARERILAEATATGRAVAGTDAERSRELLEIYVQTNNGEALLVDREGRPVARAGSGPLDTRPDLLRRASEGVRTVEDVGDLKVAIAPVVYRDRLTGGVILASGDENLLFRMSLRSSLEAAGVAGVLGGGLMFLLATMLARRIGRLASGARAIEGGDLGHRIEPGPGDELGELAEDFNSMAGRLESYIAWLEAERKARNTLLNSLSEGVVAATSEGGMLFANDAARGMLGLGDDEESGELPNPWEDFDLPGAVKRCVLERDCGMARVEGGETFLQVMLDLLPGFDDGEDGVLVVIQNLSEGRRLEAEQQRFLGKAAHELKTPITAIVGAAELLEAEVSLEPEVRRNLLGYILSEGRRMQRLSDTMLRLARTGRDLREPGLREVDLGRAAREAAGRIEPLAQSAGVEVQAVDEDAGCALADPEWLDQALLILLNNAVQYSDKDGRVWVEVSDNRIAVADEGRGIGPDELPHIFENFYSGRQSSEGFGLGLPICKEMVERMDGSVSVSSGKGAGTRFELELARPGDAPAEIHRRL